MLPKIASFDLAHDRDRTVLAAYDGRRCEVIDVPPEAGQVVSAVTFKGQVIVACSHRVYRLEGTRLVPIRFQLS